MALLRQLELKRSVSTQDLFRSDIMRVDSGDVDDWDHDQKTSGSWVSIPAV